MANGGLDLRQIKLGIRVVGRQLDIPVVSPKVLGRCVLEMPLGDEFLPCRYCRPQTYYTDRQGCWRSQSVLTKSPVAINFGRFAASAEASKKFKKRVQVITVQRALSSHRGAIVFSSSARFFRNGKKVANTEQGVFLL